MLSVSAVQAVKVILGPRGWQLWSRILYFGGFFIFHFFIFFYISYSGFFPCENIDGLVQDYSNSTAIERELLQSCTLAIDISATLCRAPNTPDSKIHGANMRATWVLSAPDGPHVGLMNLAIRDCCNENLKNNRLHSILFSERHKYDIWCEASMVRSSG